MRKTLHRARTGVRRSGVDYFRGDGSDWIALAGLLLTVPAIAAATHRHTRLVLALRARPPDRGRRPAAAPGEPARPVRGGGHRADRRVVSSAPTPEGPGRVTPGTVLVVAACGLFGLLIAQFRSRVGVPWRRGGTMLFDLRERIRVQSKLPRLPQGWHREMALRPAGGQSFSGDFVVAARTERRPHPGGRPHRRLRQGHGRGLPRPAALGRLRRPARLAAARTPSSRPPTAICSARTGTRASPPPSTSSSTSTRGDYELFSAGHLPGAPTPRGQRPLGGEVGRGPAAGRLRRRPVRPGQGLACAPATC